MVAKYTNILMSYNFDVDIDVADRELLLKHLDYTNARTEGQKRKLHPSGIYLQPIPFNPFHNVANIDHRTANDMGYFKIDVLNNSIYEGIKDENHVIELMDREPLWDLFLHKEVVEKLPHISEYLDLLLVYKPKSVEELAMVLALIRPGKKHLIGKTFTEIETDIWQEPENGDYYYKKSHSIAYALSIVVALNKYVDSLF